MRNLKISTFIFAFFLLLSSSCDKDESPPCQDTGESKIVQTYDFFPVNSPNARVQNIDENQKVVNLIIRNQKDYEKYIRINPSTTRPTIDFTRNILLAGRIKYHQCGYINEQKISSSCDGILYEVKVEEFDCHALTDIYYFALIATTDKPINFKVNE